MSNKPLDTPLNEEEDEVDKEVIMAGEGATNEVLDNTDS